MSSKNILVLHIKGEVDRNYAEGLTTRIRAAIRNGISNVQIYWDGSYTITSAEFLGFLLTTAKHLKKNGGGLELHTPTGKLNSLMRIANLHDYVVAREEGAENNILHETAEVGSDNSQGVHYE